MLVAVTATQLGRTGNFRREVTFFYLGVAARAFGMPLLVISPRSMNKARKTLYGQLFSEGEWIWGEYRAERLVVYDAMYLDELKSHRKSFRRLMRDVHRSHIPVFNPVLPSKQILYQKILKQGATVYQYPRSWFDIDVSAVVQRLDEEGRLWLKPVFGSGGENIIVLEKRAHANYHATTKESLHSFERLSRTEVIQLISKALRQRVFLAQEHLELCQTSDGRKLDFRVTVVRDEKGAWHVIALTLRIGQLGAIMTNHHAGGTVVSLTTPTIEQMQWLQAMGVTRVDLLLMKGAALSVAKDMESAFPRIGALGIDIGLSQQSQLYVYDVNSRPGRDILSDRELAGFMWGVAAHAHHLTKGCP